MGFKITRGDSYVFEERPGYEGQTPRQGVDLTPLLELSDSRARLWRFPPHTRGRRHKEPTQEEVFVVLAGTLTVLLGEPAERFDLPPHSVVSLEPGTAIQLRNETAAELVFFAYGAPPIAGPAEILADIPTL